MKIAIFGQYYQNNTAEIVTKVVQFLEAKSISIAFEKSRIANKNNRSRSPTDSLLASAAITLRALPR